jgi:threonine/homoserine/homoserine lactone efflux protein
MHDWILSTIALLGCAFMIYVFFHWLRDEENPKRPRERREPSSLEDRHLPPQRPFIVGSPRHHF